MATTNINKIVRGGNLNFKPWIAGKNTSEIVNGYVQKFYRQVPDNYRNDLLKPRQVGASKAPNQFPLKKVTREKFTIPSISAKANSKLRSNGYRSPSITVKNSFTSPRKLLKTPNFKIYPRRRYASSIASSKSSAVRNKTKNINDEYRRKIYTPALGIQFHTKLGYNESSLIPKQGISPKRLYNDPNIRTNTTEVSKAICNDLMALDDVLKSKISSAKPKALNVEPFDVPKENVLKLSLKDWNHPSIEHYKKLTTIPTFKEPQRGSLNSGLSSFNLMPVSRKHFTGNISKPFSPAKKTHSILRPSGSSHLKGSNTKPGTTLKKDNCPHDEMKSSAVTRHFDELNSRTKPIVTSKGISNDLMSVDDVLKKKIFNVNLKPLPRVVQPVEIPSKGWNLPSMEHYFNKRLIKPIGMNLEKCDKESLISELSSLRLMPIRRKTLAEKASNLVSNKRLEKARTNLLSPRLRKGLSVVPTREHNFEQPLSFGSRRIVKAKLKGFKFNNATAKDQKYYNPQRAMEFVSLSHADKSLRSRNYEGTRGYL